MQKDLHDSRGQRDTVREELDAIERRLGTLIPELKRLDAESRKTDARLEKMQAARRQENERLARHRASLAQQVRAAYALGPREDLKMLLSQDDPSRLARISAYHRVFQTARAEQIGAFHKSLARLDQLEIDARAEATESKRLRSERLAQKVALDREAKRRGELVATLSRAVRTKEREVKRLESDRDRLERLVREIKPMLRELPAAPAGAPFSTLAGRLPLPVPGRIVAHYNDPKPFGDMRWRGVFLAIREGEPVRAVARGRVIYADTLRGFGLLLILEHGDGYMSLYGHNQSLSKEIGNWVEGGEIVAVTGSTGDAPRSGLYFEIRHQGQPQDPLRWCAVGRR